MSRKKVIAPNISPIWSPNQNLPFGREPSFGTGLYGRITTANKGNQAKSKHFVAKPTEFVTT